MEDTLQAEWNFDAAELMLLFDKKSKFSELLEDLNAENIDDAYKALRAFWRECDAKLKPDEREQFKNEIDIIEEKRAVFYADGFLDNKELGMYARLLEDFYLELSYKLKEHGIYFREKDDMEDGL